MLKRLYFCLLFVTAIGPFAAQAQTDGAAGVGPSAHHKPTGLLNEKFLTPTGETVAHPGEPQGAPTRALDRGANSSAVPLAPSTRRHGGCGFSCRRSLIGSNRLATALKAAGVKVWLDRNDIMPGQWWKDAINEAIQKGAFFIACFSRELNDRQETIKKYT